jgi:transcription elongation factor GreA
MSDTVNEISPEGKAEAEAELQELIEEKRPRIVAAIKAAREEGDLSENAEYHAAREEQGHLEARIRILEELLANAEVVVAPSGDTAQVGSSLRFRDAGSGEEKDVTLVHRLEASMAEGKLSAESPVGRALLGSKKGDTVTFETPSGQKKLEILSLGS